MVCGSYTADVGLRHHCFCPQNYFCALWSVGASPCNIGSHVADDESLKLSQYSPTPKGWTAELAVGLWFRRRRFEPTREDFTRFEHCALTSPPHHRYKRARIIIIIISRAHPNPHNFSITLCLTWLCGVPR